MRADAAGLHEARFFLPAAIAIATALSAWLRIHGLTAQIVQDDEWHAIHKLMSSGYGEIFRSFGFADHSIPLTLLYKAMADTVGLAEGRMRALQVACGVALVPACAMLAWRITRDGPATALFSFLVAGAPFLVLYSRTARPYAITLLLIVLALAALWRWRTRRSAPLAACVALAASLSAWLHPVSAVFPAVACLFVFLEDLAAPRAGDARAAWGSFALGALVAAAMLAPLAVPLAHDWGSLAAKAGRSEPSLQTLSRMLSIFLGGLPGAATAALAAVALVGAGSLMRDRPRLALYLVALAAAPVAIVALAGAQWSHQAHTFGRYVMPVQLILLFWISWGAVAIARAVAGSRAALGAWGTAATLAAGYLVATPAIAQVLRLGAWYGHIYHQYDYDERYNLASAQYRGFEPPAFYRRLGRMAPGSAPVVEAPFTAGAPANAFAFFSTFHRQPEKMGMLHDLCLDGPRLDEPPPRDRRFRFRSFVFLDDVDGVKRSGARYLVLYREQIHGRPFREGDRCLAALTRLYGAPVDVDARAAVFDLRPSEPPPESR